MTQIEKETIAYNLLAYLHAFNKLHERDVLYIGELLGVNTKNICSRNGITYRVN